MKVIPRLVVWAGTAPGYAFIRDSGEGLIGYGPGQFKAAIEIINFEVSNQGGIYVSMIFVANRPERIANVSVNPVDWSFRLADLFSFGMTSKLFAPLKSTLERVQSASPSFDPVYGFVSLGQRLYRQSGGAPVMYFQRATRKRLPGPTLHSTLRHHRWFALDLAANSRLAQRPGVAGMGQKGEKRMIGDCDPTQHEEIN